MTQSTPLWGAYLEMTLGEGDTRRRRQWIFSPPVPEEVARTVGMEVVASPAYWYREQSSPDNKSTWTVKHLTGPGPMSDLLRLVKDSEDRSWVANPLVTCELHPLEMKDIVESGWKTPWRIINRVTRVAKFKHNYVI